MQLWPHRHRNRLGLGWLHDGKAVEITPQVCECTLPARYHQSALWQPCTELGRLLVAYQWKGSERQLRRTASV